MMIREVTVDIGTRPYTVRIADELLTWIGVQVQDLQPRPSSQMVVVADASLRSLYKEPVLHSLEQAGFVVDWWEVASGESSKSLVQLEPILSAMARHRMDRGGVLLALGGGVIGDLAGFAAAVYQRGISLIQVPTTLLAMVDSSVGGKTGVNLPEGKNLVGSFHQPSLVVADLATLKTLPARELAAGMAEVIKYGCIADHSLFDLVQGGGVKDWASIVQRCVEIKADVVEADPFETNSRRATLNFGHTLGHAVENAAGYGVVLHGEAVAIGMRAAAHLSRKKCGLSEEAVKNIEQAIQNNSLPKEASGLSRQAIMQALRLDKKAKAGVYRWVLLRQIGETALCDDVSAADIEELLDLVLVNTKP